MLMERPAFTVPFSAIAAEMVLTYILLKLLTTFSLHIDSFELSDSGFLPASSSPKVREVLPTQIKTEPEKIT